MEFIIQSFPLSERSNSEFPMEFIITSFLGMVCQKA